MDNKQLRNTASMDDSYSTSDDSDLVHIRLCPEFLLPSVEGNVYQRYSELLRRARLVQVSNQGEFEVYYRIIASYVATLEEITRTADSESSESEHSSNTAASSSSSESSEEDDGLLQGLLDEWKAFERMLTTQWRDKLLTKDFDFLRYQQVIFLDNLMDVINTRKAFSNKPIVLSCYKTLYFDAFKTLDFRLKLRVARKILDLIIPIVEEKKGAHDEQIKQTPETSLRKRCEDFDKKLHRVAERKKTRHGRRYNAYVEGLFNHAWQPLHDYNQQQLSPLLSTVEKFLTVFPRNYRSDTVETLVQDMSLIEFESCYSELHEQMSDNAKKARSNEKKLMRLDRLLQDKQQSEDNKKRVSIYDSFTEDESLTEFLSTLSILECASDYDLLMRFKSSVSDTVQRFLTNKRAEFLEKIGCADTPESLSQVLWEALPEAQRRFKLKPSSMKSLLFKTTANYMARLHHLLSTNHADNSNDELIYLYDVLAELKKRTPIREKRKIRIQGANICFFERSDHGAHQSAEEAGKPFVSIVDPVKNAVLGYQNTAVGHSPANFFQMYVTCRDTNTLLISGKVISHEECIFTSLFGITRKAAFQYLLNNVENIWLRLILPVLALLGKKSAHFIAEGRNHPFIVTLKKQNLCSKSLLDISCTWTYNSSAGKDFSYLRKRYQQELDFYDGQPDLVNLDIVIAYLKYQLQPQVLKHAIGAHPEVLMALASLKKINLHLWEVFGPSLRLQPYAPRYRSEKTDQERIDLAMFNGTRFQYLEKVPIEPHPRCVASRFGW